MVDRVLVVLDLSIIILSLVFVACQTARLVRMLEHSAVIASLH